MLLVEAGQNDLIFHNMTNIAFFDMLKIVLNKSITKNEAKEKVIEYALKHNVDETVVMSVAGATNRKIDYNALSRKGDFTMWSFFEEIAKEGEAKGIIETGLEFNLSEKDILERLQKKLNLSLQMAQEYFKMFGKQTV